MIEPAPKSTFVTVVAWTFLVLSGFAAFIGILQNTMIWFLFPRSQIHDAMNSQEIAKNTNIFFRTFLGHTEFYFLAFFLVALFTFLTSVGLLRRREWARKAFIGLMALGILWNLGSCVMQLFMFGLHGPFPDEPQGGSEFRVMMVVMQVFTWVFAVALSVLFGWIINRLMSPNIVKEFREAG